MAGVTVDFNANLAQLQSGIDQANQQLNRFGEGASRLSEGISGTLTALGIGLSAAGIVSFGKSVIDAADDMNDLSLKTGIAVETLSGLQLAADQSGTDLEGAAAAINKLSKNIGVNSEEFAKLGITAKDPLQAFEQLADVFVSIQDPQERAAFGAKALGKSWEDVAPLLSLGGQGLAEIVEKGSAASGITTELAQASDNFNDSLAELQANTKGLAVQGFAPLVPILNELIGYFSAGGDEADKFNDSSDVLRGTYKLLAESVAVVGYGFEIAGKHLGAFVAQTVALENLDFSGFAEIDKALEEDLKKADSRLNDFFNKIENGAPKSIDIPVDPQKNAVGDAVGAAAGDAGVAKRVNDFVGSGGKTAGVAEFNKSLEADLARHNKIIQGHIEEEVSLYGFRNEKLDAALNLGAISQADYFQQKEKLQKDQLASTQAYLDQEINAIQFSQKQQQELIDEKIAAQEKLRDSATNPTAKAGAQSKIDDLQGQKLEVESGAQQQISELLQKKTELERDSQVQTLQNAVAAKQALGDQAEGLVNVNGLLEQYLQNTIGLSKAQAELNTQQGGTASAADAQGSGKIFVSQDGKSFSDRPTEVGIALDLPQDQESKIQDQLTQLRDNAVANSAIMLGVDIDQSLVIAAAQRARDAAQQAIQPVIIPVVYQAQNSPTTAAGGNVDLAQAALARGSR